MKQKNTIKYEGKRIEKARVAAGLVANGTATPTSTAKPTPKKRFRKPKAVHHMKRIGLEKEEEECIAAALSVARITAHAKLRGNSPAEHRFFVS